MVIFIAKYLCSADDRAVEERVAIAIFQLASSSEHRMSAAVFGVSPSSVHNYLHR